MPTVTLPSDMPAHMKRLPRDTVGRPIPFFAAYVNGEHDFRLMDSAKLVQAIRDQLCWVCGQRLNRQRNSENPRGTFVAGPMCLINRTSAEPPSHGDCAAWSARACPFLTKPGKERRETNLPGELAEPAGLMIARNPGVTALISSLRWKVWNPQRETGVGGAGLLFEFSRIENVMWMCEGRQAYSHEVLASIESGLPELIRVANDQPGAMPHLARKLRTALDWVAPGFADDVPNIRWLLERLP